MIRRFQILFFAIFIFIYADTVAQQMLVSSAAQDDFSLGYTKVIGQDENGYFVLTSNLSLNIITDRQGFKSRKYKAGYFNTTLNRQWEVDVNAQPNDATIDAISFFNGKIMVISSLPDKAAKKLKYYITFIDATGKENKIPNPVVEFNVVAGEYEKCKVVISTSAEKFALVTREFLGDKNQPVFGAVINSDLATEQIKSGLIPFSEKTFDFEGYALSNNGDLVLLGLHSEKIKTLSSKRKNDYFIYSSPHDTAGFKEFNISGDKLITGLGIAFDNINQQAVMAGFYSDKESFIGAGIYYATLKMESNNEVTIKASSIDTQQNIRLKGERNSGSGINLISYPIERIVVRQDGGAVLVAEAAYTTEYSFYDTFSQSFTRRIEYNFDNVIIISINSSGKADWSSIVDKQQVSLDDGGIYSSFCSLLNSEQLVIIYNDDIGRRNKIVPASINNLGVMTRMKPFTQSEGSQLFPRSGKQVSENEFVVPALVKRKLHLIKFTF